METNLLKSTPVFKGIDEVYIKKLANLGQEAVHAKGHIIFREGEEAKALYILRDGQVSLEMRVDMGQGQGVHQATVDTAKKGAAFGWSALVEPHKYTLTATCLEPVSLIVFEADKLRNLLESDPNLGYQVMKRMAGLVASRLEHTRSLLLSERGLSNVPSWRY